MKLNMHLEDYIQLSGPLFEAVQNSHLFSDGKTFVDAYPKEAASVILNLYHSEKNLAGFSLSEFILKHFDFPKAKHEKLPEKTSMLSYIEAAWAILEKEMVPSSPHSTLISLPKPHIVPGGRFQECFYWDSYFTALGLGVCNRIDSIKNIVQNFASLIDRFGFIPNGNRVYFLSRSQPPYFSHLLELLSDLGEESWALSYFHHLEKEYAYWMGSNLTVEIGPGTTLNRYYDDLDIPRPEAYGREINLLKNPKADFFRNLRTVCASGWDFSSRWFKDPSRFETVCALDILPVDLNCLLYDLETTLARFASNLNHADLEKTYLAAADKRKEAIHKIFWNTEKKFFFDYNYRLKKQTETWSLAAASPLFSSLATDEQAKAIAAHLKKHFLFPGGFATSLYEGIHQWDMPNGWAPLQWITIQGLLNYGEESLAQEGAKRWLHLCDRIFKERKTVLEKYNVKECSARVVEGEYELQIGFGWTNGTILALMNYLHRYS